MAQMYNFPNRSPSIEKDPSAPHTIKHGDGDGGGDDMLDRVKKLEGQVLTLVSDIAVIKSNYVTKADLHEEISKQTKWIAATIIGTTGLALTIAKLIF
jgi:hypothetical protein